MVVVKVLSWSFSFRFVSLSFPLSVSFGDILAQHCVVIYMDSFRYLRRIESESAKATANVFQIIVKSPQNPSNILFRKRTPTFITLPASAESTSTIHHPTEAGNAITFKRNRRMVTGSMYSQFFLSHLHSYFANFHRRRHFQFANPIRIVSR